MPSSVANLQWKGRLTSQISPNNTIHYQSGLWRSLRVKLVQVSGQSLHCQRYSSYLKPHFPFYLYPSAISAVFEIFSSDSLHVYCKEASTVFGSGHKPLGTEVSGDTVLSFCAQRTIPQSSLTMPVHLIDSSVTGARGKVNRARKGIKERKGQQSSH